MLFHIKVNPILIYVFSPRLSMTLYNFPLIPLHYSHIIISLFKWSSKNPNFIDMGGFQVAFVILRCNIWIWNGFLPIEETTTSLQKVSSHFYKIVESKKVRISFVGTIFKRPGFDTEDWTGNFWWKMTKNLIGKFFDQNFIIRADHSFRSCVFKTSKKGLFVTKE